MYKCISKVTQLYFDHFHYFKSYQKECLEHNNMHAAQRLKINVKAKWCVFSDPISYKIICQDSECACMTLFDWLMYIE